MVAESARHEAHKVAEGTRNVAHKTAHEADRFGHKVAVQARETTAHAEAKFGAGGEEGSATVKAPIPTGMKNTAANGPKP